MEDDRSSASDGPPSKKQRVLACRRCRSRKQRCEGTRPCSNCTKSGEECQPTAPAPRPHVEVEYVRVLEERIAELESLDPQQSLDHIRRPSVVPDGSVTAVDRPSNGIHRGVTNSVEIVSPNESRRRASKSIAESSPAYPPDEDEDSGMDHLILGLVASPAVARMDQSVSETSPNVGDPSTQGRRDHGSQLPSTNLPDDLIDLMLEAFRERAQTQYPFLHWDTFLEWHASWKNCPPTEIRFRAWQGFFVNVVFATSLILLRRPTIGTSDAQTFYRKGISLLPFVLERDDKILHIQAYLLLAMRALHQSSTERIISLSSTTMRYCVQQQLHLAETEPVPTDPFVRFQNQVRRRCFWCAYKLDRLVMLTFDIPPSIPDAMITVPLFANIDDEDLLQAATNTASHSALEDAPHYTCVSSSLHILQCRRIQSEISAITLRWDYTTHYENSPDWRIRILAELENYKSRVQSFSNPQSKGYTSQRWLAMIYHYTLLMLYRPTKTNVLGPAGDWSVQASTQACLMFRKTQMDRQIAQPWLGVGHYPSIASRSLT